MCRKYRVWARRKYPDRARRLSVFLSGFVDDHGKDAALHVDVLVVWAFRVLVLEEPDAFGGMVFAHLFGADVHNPYLSAYRYSVRFESLAAGERGRHREAHRRSRR